MPSKDDDSISKKRRTNEIQSQVSVNHGSKIFAPFRSIGHVTGPVPFATTSLGDSFLITTSVGRFFQIYDASNLHLLFVSSPQTDSDIQCLHSHFHYVYASWNNKVGVFKRGKLETLIEIDVQQEEGDVCHLLRFGDYLCTATNSRLYVYKAGTAANKEGDASSASFDLHTSINIPKGFGSIVKILHPPTYLNKLVVVTETCVMLFNVRTGKLLYASEQEFIGTAKLTTAECAPVLDILAVATADGAVLLYHLKHGKVLFSLDAGERITTMSFRTDGDPMLAVGLASGTAIFYNLNLKKRVHVLRQIHSESRGGLTEISFLNGQPIFLTSGGDNILKEFCFDPSIVASDSNISSPPRLLRSRGGHSEAPNFICFTDEDAHHILSSSRDRSLWSFSLRKDSQSHEFSQKSKGNSAGKRKAGLTSGLQTRFPEITCLAYQADKQGRWDNIVTAHRDADFARSWDGHRGIVGKFQLKTTDGGIVKSVAISQCGNFALIGSSLGRINVYNLQSGLLLPRKFKGHNKAVTGLVIDSLNKIVISSSLDGYVVFYDFSTGIVLHKVGLGSSVNQLCLHFGSDLLAVSLDNLSIAVIDILTKRKVRELWGHSNRITSFDFSPDGRWIVSASLDGTLRTWDLPTGGCIDAARVSNVITALKISPNGDWLATCHVQGVGINLWTNRAQFHNVSTRHITDEEIQSLILPTASGEGGVNILDGAFEFDDFKPEDEEIVDVSQQLSKDLITLSLMPRSKFMTLNHLDVIKLRNKPKEAVKKPEKAPFFLSAQAVDNTANKDEDDSFTDEKPRIMNPEAMKLAGESEFTRLLREGRESGSYKEFIAYLITLSPSVTDLEIRSLGIFEPFTELISFLNALSQWQEQKKDYELVQAWMAMVLRIHGDVIYANYQNEELSKALAAVEIVQQQDEVRLDYLSKNCSGILNFLRFQ